MRTDLVVRDDAGDVRPSVSFSGLADSLQPLALGDCAFARRQVGV